MRNSSVNIYILITWKKQQFAITILGLENIIIVTTETKKQVKDKYLTNLTKYNVYISKCFYKCCC